MLIFDNSHAKQNVAVVIYHPGILGKALSKHPEPLLVQEIRPLSFSQANRNHFDQSGLIGAAESGVPLDPANHNDGVGLKGESPSGIFPTSTVSILEKMGHSQNSSVMP